MGDSVEDKILLKIGGRSVFAHVLRAFAKSQTQDALIVVTRDDLQRRALAAIVEEEDPGIPVFFTLGGDQRQESVCQGLDLLPSSVRFVTIHDCARPAVTPASIVCLRKTVEATGRACSLAHRVTDTIRQFTGDPTKQALDAVLLDRDRLWAMETPQAFPRDLIERAHATLTGKVTDDLAAVEALGEPILLLESSHPNPKLTRPADLPLLEILLTQNTMSFSSRFPPIRIGHGYDIHRLEAGLPLILGGVPVRSEAGLVGHSDADVLSHAIADAILGAAGLPDIGHYFPNTDPAIKGISSLEILKRALAEAGVLGWRLVNIDATLIAEKPKVAPYVERMKRQLSMTLNIPGSDIGIKATTQEKIGALGRAAGIAAHAVVCLGRAD